MFLLILFCVWLLCIVYKGVVMLLHPVLASHNLWFIVVAPACCKTKLCWCRRRWQRWRRYDPVSALRQRVMSEHRHSAHMTSCTFSISLSSSSIAKTANNYRLVCCIHLHISRVLYCQCPFFITFFPFTVSLLLPLFSTHLSCDTFLHDFLPSFPHLYSFSSYPSKFFFISSHPWSSFCSFFSLPMHPVCKVHKISSFIFLFHGCPSLSLHIALTFFSFVLYIRISFNVSYSFQFHLNSKAD